MRRLKLTAISFFITSIILISCKQEDYLLNHNYENAYIVMDGTKEVPANASTATGVTQAYYNQATKTLTYKVYWSGLSGNATKAHIHGTGETGVNVELSSLLQTLPSFPLTATGSFSGTVFMDGIIFKEEQLLAGQYYINIHTATYPGTAAKPYGEIRGQLLLTKK